MLNTFTITTSSLVVALLRGRMRHENEQLQRGTGFCAWHALCDRSGDPRCWGDPHLAKALVASHLVAGVTIFAMLVLQGGWRTASLPETLP